MNNRFSSWGRGIYGSVLGGQRYGEAQQPIVLRIGKPTCCPGGLAQGTAIRVTYLRPIISWQRHRVRHNCRLAGGRPQPENKGNRVGRRFGSSEGARFWCVCLLASCIVVILALFRFSCEPILVAPWRSKDTRSVGEAGEAGLWAWVLLRTFTVGGQRDGGGSAQKEIQRLRFYLIHLISIPRPPPRGPARLWPLLPIPHPHPTPNLGHLYRPPNRARLRRPLLKAQPLAPQSVPSRRPYLRPGRSVWLLP